MRAPSVLLVTVVLVVVVVAFFAVVDFEQVYFLIIGQNAVIFGMFVQPM